MTTLHTAALLTMALLVTGCAERGNTQGDLDELKASQREMREEIMAGQQELREELAAMRKMLEPKAAPSRVAEIDLDVDTDGDPFTGSADAPLVIIEYTDYQCPFCARHAKSVLPLIQKDYVDTGKVRYVARDFPLPFHKQAPKASEAAHCASDQDRYWEMHEQLFNNQKALGEEQLSIYASNIGLDAGAFSDCLGSGKYAALVERNIAEARKAGINGTPSFVIGYSDGDDGDVEGERLLRGALGYASFQQAFDELLANRK